jgi:hypothetical protein
VPIESRILNFSNRFYRTAGYYDALPHIFEVAIAKILVQFANPSSCQMAGQEGIEPPTCGFGDRRSAN